MPLCSQYHQRGGQNYLSHPSSPIPGHTPALAANRKGKLATTQGASKQGKLLFVPAPHCCIRDPSKASPGLPVWPVVNVYLLRKAKNPGQYHIHPPAVESADS